MPDLRDDASAAEADVRAYLRAAAQSTNPPAAFDVGAAVSGGRRLVRRRRAGVLSGLSLVAASVLAVAMLVGVPDRRTAPPAEPTPSPTSTSATDKSQRAQFAALLADPEAVLGGVYFADRQTASATLHRCGDDGCTASALLLTTDGWETIDAAHLLKTASVWFQPLADGSVAFVPHYDSPEPPGILHRDASVTDLTVSLDPAPATETSMPVNGPTLDADVPGGMWTLDPPRAVVAPLRTSPPGSTINLPIRDDTGAVYGVFTGAGPSPATLLVAGSSDGGRTWPSTSVRATSDQPVTSSTLALGPDGRAALILRNDDGGVEFFESTDGGQTWARRQLDQPRRFDATNLAYAADGAVLMVEEVPDASVAGRVWALAPGSTRPERVADAPRVNTLSRTGGVLTGGRDTSRSLWVSEDGRQWQRVDLPREADSYSVARER